MNNASSPRHWPVAMMFAFLLLLLPAAWARNSSAPKEQMQRQLLEVVAEVRNGETSASRTDAAWRLAMLTRRINPHKVDETTLAEIIALLDTQEDSVRGWVAGALGFLGPRAKAAAPRLLKLLPEVDCLRGSLTSASAIRLALKRMGKTPPPRPNCHAKE